MFRSVFSGLVTVVLLAGVSLPLAAAAAGDPFPEAAAAYVVNVNGTAVWRHNSTRRLPPASLTKMMTSLVVMEKADLRSVVTVSRTAARETGTRIGLRSGERITVGALLAATMLASANDACRALADHVGGDEVRFVRLMNERAAKMGLRDTHFSNSCGHHDPLHYSTAEDLSIVAGAVMGDPLLEELVSRVELDVYTAGRRRILHLRNRNELIGRYRYAVGVKTGFTSQAGECLAAVAKNEGDTVLLILLNAPNRWWKAEAMLNRAFSLARSGRVAP